MDVRPEITDKEKGISAFTKLSFKQGEVMGWYVG